MLRYKRFHSSVILAWLALGLLGGIAATLWLPFKVPVILLIPAILLLVGVFRSRKLFAVVLAVVCGFWIGLIRGGGFSNDLSRLESYVGQQQTFSAKISYDPSNDDLPSVWQVRLSDIQIGDNRYNGEIYATIISEQQLQRGDSVVLSGKFREGFGSFSLSMYRASLDDITPSGDQLLAFRNGFGESVRRVVPEPEASLGLGFLVGQKSALDSDFEEQLRVVGLTHIVVASGFNLTILVRFARRLLSRHSRYLALSVSLGLVGLFVAISGMSPSMNRAAVVTILSLMAWYYGRTFHPIKLILYVAAGSAFFYPTYLWGDLGWMLSFAAFFGVLVVSPLVVRVLGSGKYAVNLEDRPVVRLIIETASAQIMTAPIIAFSFGSFSLISLIANLLVAPVVPFAMALTAFAGIVGLFGNVVWLASPASVILAYVVAVVKWLSGMSWANMPVQVSAGAVVLFYLAVGVWVTVLWLRHETYLRQSSMVV